MLSQLTSLVELPETCQVLSDVASGILAPEAEGGCPWRWLEQLIHFLQALPGGSRLQLDADMPASLVTGSTTLRQHCQAAAGEGQVGDCLAATQHSSSRQQPVPDMGACWQDRGGDQQQCRGHKCQSQSLPWQRAPSQAGGKTALGILVWHSTRQLR